MADERGGAGEAQLPHHTVRKLMYEEGGGYLVEFPDHPGCIADGETVARRYVRSRRRMEVIRRNRPRVGT